MNRLREIRELRGMTQQEAADALGTTSTHISRLENERSDLTHKWLVRFAKLYRVRPQDLIQNVEVTEECIQEVEAMPATDPVFAAIARRGMRVYKVTESAVEGAGIRTGDVITVDESKAAVTNVQLGDVVLVAVGKARKKVLRQFVPPAMIITNRPDAGANQAVTMSDPTVAPEIVGVYMSPDQPPNGEGKGS
jgi:transcriptional regulator with XRE-family HTH domain